MSSKSKKFYLSASRIDTFQNCSQLYAAKYLWKLPDAGNDGSNRGSTVHDVLELLLKPKHKKRYDDAIHHKTCKKVPTLWRVINKFAKKYKVNNDENLNMIDDFIMVALKYDFFGGKNVVEITGEKEFTIDIDSNGKKYAMRGFIDQTFKIKDKDGIILSVRDFKTSKAKFSGDKLDDNIQSQIYQLALKHLYPDIKKRNFHFMFLKFPQKPRQDQPSFTDSQLSGFEWFLTELQKQMENFTIKNSQDNLAVFDEKRQWLCGKEGKKKDGSPAWICSARFPIDFFVKLSEDGGFMESAFTEQELKPKDKERIEKRRYPGCSFYFSENGQRRNFQ